jgi:hypothetical protein
MELGGRKKNKNNPVDEQEHKGEGKKTKLLPKIRPATSPKFPTQKIEGAEAFYINR